MKRLLLVGAVAAFGWLGSPAQANEEEDWACVYVDRITFGVCMGNPLPEQLPIRDACADYFDPPADATCAVWPHVPPLSHPLIDEVEECATGSRSSPTIPDVPDICG